MSSAQKYYKQDFDDQVATITILHPVHLFFVDRPLLSATESDISQTALFECCKIFPISL